MNSAVIQLLVLAGVAIFLILRLKNVLGTRDGFERPIVPVPDAKDASAPQRGLKLVSGGVDADITDHVAAGTPAAKALAAMKLAEPKFNVNDFLRGSRGAYEMILMAFQKGHLDPVVPFLAREVHDSFQHGIDAREAQGLTVEATFIGIRELTLTDATYNPDTKVADITIRFVGELTSAARNAAGEIVEGSLTETKRQQDVWTFSRRMGSNDPNWQLVATGE